VFAREKQCEACGKPFECGGLFNCWCRTVKLDAATREQLRASFADCLCPTCLEAAQKQGTVAPATPVTHS
jgi:hypothetical protein